MIIDTGRYIFYNKSFRLKKSCFFKCLNINPRSYIGQIISRIHDYYFKNSHLIKKDFKKYYKKEFSSFENFLDKKHNLFQNEIKELNHNNAYYSEKIIAERFKVCELLNNDFGDNVISKKIFEILNVDKDNLEIDFLYEDFDNDDLGEDSLHED
jgi:hypothetical protein